jgi:hypothetical protein
MMLSLEVGKMVGEGVGGTIGVDIESKFKIRL